MAPDSTFQVLIIAPNDPFTEQLNDLLTREYKVDRVEDVESSLFWLAKKRAELVIVHADLEFDVIQLVRTLRAAVTAGIVILTPHSEVEIAAAALDAGADAYLESIPPVELLNAWFRALTRRVGAEEPLREGVVILDAARRMVLDAHAKAVRKGPNLISLTPIEYRILHELAYRPGEAIPRGTLHSLIWENEGLSVSGRPLDIHMSRLRRKLEIDPRSPRLIVTVRREGYRLDVR